MRKRRHQVERDVLRALWALRREAYLEGTLDDNFRAPLPLETLARRASLAGEHEALAAVQRLALRGAVVLYFTTLTSAGPVLRLWRGGEPERAAKWLFALHPATLWRLNSALLAN